MSKMNELESRVRESLTEHAYGPLDAFRLPDLEVLDLIESKQYSNFTAEFRAWLDSQMDDICERQGQ